jgi:ankyrin repeat protein
MQQLKKIKTEEGHSDSEETSVEKLDSLLYRAAGKGDLKIVKALIAEGVEVDVPDYKRRTPLFAASAGGHAEVVKYLLEAGADPLRKNLKGEVSLMLACRSSSLATVQCLVEAGAPLTGAPTPCDVSNTPLNVASARGYLDIVEYLISKGAIPNAPSWSPMISACANGHVEVVKCLEKHGVSLQGINVLSAPLSAACYHGQMEVVEYLISRGVPIDENGASYRKPLHHACAGGHFEIVKYLIRCGADKYSALGNNQTPAHEAGRKGHFEIFEYLTQDLSRYRVEKIKDECAVMAAGSEGLSVLEYLLEKRECKSEVLAKCLISAIENHNHEPVEYLLGFGIDLEKGIYDRKGRTFLHLAVDNHMPNIARLLISKGANVNALSDKNVLPIHRAARTGDVEICRLLLENGADLHARTHSGKTPLAYASRRGDLKTLDYLIEQGAKPVISEDCDDTNAVWGVPPSHLFDSEQIFCRLAEAGFLPNPNAFNREDDFWPTSLIEKISKSQTFFLTKSDPLGFF